MKTQPGMDSSVPATAQILTAMRHEMNRWIKPYLKEAGSLVTYNMLENLLLQIALREENLPHRLSTRLEEQLDALAILADTEGDSDTLHRGEQLKKELSELSEEDAERKILRSERWIMDALESAISRTMPALPNLETGRREQARSALHTAVHSEKMYLNGFLEDYQELAVRKGSRATQLEGLDPVAFKHYLKDKIPEAEVEIGQVKTVLGGYSKETFIVELKGSGRPADAVVIRRDSVGGPVEGSAADELDIVSKMYRAGVPVAEPLWAEHGSQVLGRPFNVVKCVPGKPALDMNYNPVEGEDGAQHSRLLAQVLAKIHSLDLDVLELPPELQGLSLKEHVTRMLDQFEDQWHRRRPWRSAIIASGLAWMKENIPLFSARPTLVHGDAALRNMLVHNGQVSAMLDWELWHIGDPIEDLAYCKFEVERVLPWQEFLDEYYAHGGREYDEQSGRFYELWPKLRNSIMAMNILSDFESTPDCDDVRQPFSSFYHYPMLVGILSDELLTQPEFGAT